MSRARYLFGLVLSAGLVVLVLGAFGVSSASAAPVLKVCKEPPGALIGLWKTNQCNGTNELKGKFVWAWPDNNGKATEYCVLGGKEFKDPLCEESSSGGPFLIHLTNEAFPRWLGVILLSVLVAHAGGVATTLHCEGGAFSGQPATKTLQIKNVVDYTGCTASVPANCEVSSGGVAPLGLIITNPLDGVLESLTLTNLTPEGGLPFVTILYSGASCALKNKEFPIKGSQMCEFNAGSNEPAEIHLLNCKKSGSALELGTEPASYEGLVHIHFPGLPAWKIW